MPGLWQLPGHKPLLQASAPQLGTGRQLPLPRRPFCATPLHSSATLPASSCASTAPDPQPASSSHTRQTAHAPKTSSLHQQSRTDPNTTKAAHHHAASPGTATDIHASHHSRSEPSTQPGPLPAHQNSSQATSSAGPAAAASTGRQDPLSCSRRTLTCAAASMAAMLVAAPGPAAASKLPAFADQAWESMGGGPSDLYFPDSFLGVWEVSSVLTSVEKPLGEEYIPNKQAVQRAITDDLMKEAKYLVKFIPTPDGGGRAIFDRRFNTAAMLAMYYGPKVDFAERVTWNPTDPNVLRLSMPGGLSVRTRVTRRSASAPAPDRIETSEYFEQIYDDGSAPPRLKANQCFTKYKWRDPQVAAKAGGPGVVATQVVSDYLTPFDGESLYMQAMNRPVAIYTYKMAFMRPS